MDFQSITNTLNSVPTEVWPLLLSALGLSAFQMKLHKWFSVQSDKVRQFITLVLSLSAAIVPAALGWMSINPQSLGAHTTLVFTAMTLFYRYVVKGAAANLAGYKEFKQSKLEAPEVVAPTAPAASEQPSNEFLGQ